jgi:predicted RNA-binding Zn ribbon-like protein
VSSAALVVALANGRRDRRPTHARVAMSHDALVDAASASRLLQPFLGRRIGAKELADVRALQRAVVAIVDALIDGSPPPLELLNRLAAKEPTIARLKRQRDGTLQATLQAKHASAVRTLIFAAIRELSELDPSRLRRCARPECTLVFYDTTRSGTQRWHAERPCGLRERQRRYRTRKPSTR